MSTKTERIRDAMAHAGLGLAVAMDIASDLLADRIRAEGHGKWLDEERTRYLLRLNDVAVSEPPTEAETMLIESATALIDGIWSSARKKASQRAGGRAH
jgi:hypothetical protein